MKINKIVIVLVLAALAIVSCKEDDKTTLSSDFFVKRSQVGFYKEAKVIYTINQSQEQLYFNTTTNTFRIISDDGINYIEVVFDSPIPRINDKVTASIKNGGLSSVENNKSIEFEVMKKEGNNCWLWNQKSGLGLIIFHIE